jgi:hypothetical protein
MPTSASDIRHAGVVPVTLRRRARAHTASAANGSTATVMSATPLNVPTQPCHPSAMPPPLPSDREIYPGSGRALLHPPSIPSTANGPRMVRPPAQAGRYNEIRRQASPID